MDIQAIFYCASVVFLLFFMIFYIHKNGTYNQPIPRIYAELGIPAIIAVGLIDLRWIYARVPSWKIYLGKAQ